MGDCFEALREGVLMAPLDSRYNQVGFNLISVQVWSGISLMDAPNCMSYCTPMKLSVQCFILMGGPGVNPVQPPRHGIKSKKHTFMPHAITF